MTGKGLSAAFAASFPDLPAEASTLAATEAARVGAILGVPGIAVMDVVQLASHGRLSRADVGYAMRHSRLHCYIGDRRMKDVLTPEFLDRSDLVDRNASLSWFDNNE